MNQFDIIRARFNPKNTDDLKEDASFYIGMVGNWQVGWWIDHGPYEGQRAVNYRPLKEAACNSVRNAPFSRRSTGYGRRVDPRP